jgi:hypothetical protein
MPDRDFGFRCTRGRFDIVQPQKNDLVAALYRVGQLGRRTGTKLVSGRTFGLVSNLSMSVEIALHRNIVRARDLDQHISPSISPPCSK